MNSNSNDCKVTRRDSDASLQTIIEDLVNALPEDLLGVVKCFSRAEKAPLQEIMQFVGTVSIKAGSFGKRIARRLVQSGIVQVATDGENYYLLTVTGRKAMNAVNNRLEAILRQHQHDFAAFLQKAMAREEVLGRWLDKGEAPWRRIGLCAKCGNLIVPGEVDLDRVRSLLKDLCTLFNAIFPENSGGGRTN